MVQEFYKSLQCPVIERYGEFFLPQSHAQYFIKKCKEHNLAIIGIDGFIQNAQENTIGARLDLIKDFSDHKSENWQDFRSSCEGLTQNFLNEIETVAKSEPNLIFNFSLISQREWEASQKKTKFKPLLKIVKNEQGKDRSKGTDRDR